MLLAKLQDSSSGAQNTEAWAALQWPLVQFQPGPLLLFKCPKKTYGFAVFLKLKTNVIKNIQENSALSLAVFPTQRHWSSVTLRLTINSIRRNPNLIFGCSKISIKILLSSAGSQHSALTQCLDRHCVLTLYVGGLHFTWCVGWCSCGTDYPPGNYLTNHQWITIFRVAKLAWLMSFGWFHSLHFSAF